MKRKNVWFCVNILSKAERRKAWCLPHNLIWADLDNAKPDKILPHPSVVLESSPMRYQALWRVEKPLLPEKAEDYSKRLAYTYSLEGSDVSGWDLTQLLRVPFTHNYKYEQEDEYVPEVIVREASDDYVRLEDLDALEPAPLTVGPEAELTEAVPKIEKLPNAEMIIYKHQMNLERTAFNSVYTYEPEIDEDWSKILWRLLNICYEAGMSSEEVFAVALTSKCNKYARDGRPASYLWRDVLKAHTQQSKLTLLTEDSKPLTMPQFVGPKECTDTFITGYRAFGEAATDAIPQFHDLAAFMLLSGLLAGNLFLNTSYGKVVPNLWGLIIGESTLTRKTTATELAVRLLHEVDEDAIVATDGTVEGLLTRLAERPGRTSVFYRDEVTGFFDSMNRKDYLAGMPEILTQLYDVPPVLKRSLRKETITINNPVFIFFGGGIKDRMYELLSDEFIYSGFLPRFLIVSGNTDLTKLRRTGPATTNTISQRLTILKQLIKMKEAYCQQTIIKIAGQEIEKDIDTEVFLSSDAWARYGDIEDAMVATAHESPMAPLALPTFERLHKSCLKMAMLLAAERQIPDKKRKIEVSEQDIINACYYMQDWGRYSIDLIKNVGRNKATRLLGKIFTSVERHPGVLKSRIMQWYHLSAREIDDIIRTLEDRGEVTMTKEGKARRLWPTM